MDPGCLVPTWCLWRYGGRLLKPSRPRAHRISETRVREGGRACGISQACVQGCCVTVSGAWEPHWAPSPGGLRSAPTCCLILMPRPERRWLPEA